MVCQKISDFYQTHYTVKFLSVLTQTWKHEKTWGCIGTPKKEHLFLLYLRGGAVYTLKDGKKINVKQGELVYTPSGSEYKIRFLDEEGDRAETMGVRFLLSDENGENITFSSDVLHFFKNKVFDFLFSDVKRVRLSVPQIPVKYDCVLYALISELGALEQFGKSNNKHFGWIQKGVEYLTEHFQENTSVKSLADMCHISEVYFRKVFKRCMGMSPVQYRSELRLKRAREYLLYSDDSVNEIAELLGYVSPAYFIKQFKEKYQESPYAYRLKHTR